MLLQLATQEFQLTQNVSSRNIEVNRAFTLITDEAQTLLKQMDTTLHRTFYEVNHSVTGGNIIKEWCCVFWSISLFKTQTNSLSIYFSYDEDALSQFGNVLLNKMLRVIFRYTMFDFTHLNIENCVRIEKSSKDVHALFIKQLQKGSENVSVTVAERLTA